MQAQELPAPAVTRRTFQLEGFRAVSNGILETALATFLLLIAVRNYQAGSLAKGFLATGASFGLLLSPLLVAMVQRLGWPVAKTASLVSFLGAAVTAAAVFSPSLPVFVACSVLMLVSMTVTVPLVTEIYHSNFPDFSRGKLFSRIVFVKIIAAMGASWLAGQFLSGRPDDFRWLIGIFSIALAVSGYLLARLPAVAIKLRPKNESGFAAWKAIGTDRVFRRLLICWMFMGFGNLMMIPLRVEYLANPRYGLSLDAATIALLTGVIPNVARLVLNPFWGRLFDRVNFFKLRITLNIAFAIGILSFFTGGNMIGLIAGALIFGAAVSGGDLAWGLWVTKIAPPEKTAGYMAVHTCLTGVRGVAAPFLAFGLIESVPLHALAILATVLILISTLILAPETRRVA